VKRYLFLIAAAPMLAGAAPAWQKQAVASATPFIERANDEWTRAIVSGNADILSAPYAKNAVFIGPDGTEIRTKAGVRTMYSRRPKSAKVLKATIHSDGRVAADPDDVYEWGSAQMTVLRNGKERYVVGRYLTVWHRSGKRWLISHNIAF
jgi:ketosteroid isomerase-like protein